MYSKAEDFGSMVVRSADWESIKKIELYFNKRLSGEQMVRQDLYLHSTFFTCFLLNSNKFINFAHKIAVV